MSSQDTQAKSEEDAKAKEVMRQEQFWFTATTLGFIGFVGALLRVPTGWDVFISLVLIWILTVFSIYLVIGRHRQYCEVNKTRFSSWSRAFDHAFRERSGALYCTVVTLFSAIAFTLIILMRYLHSPVDIGSSQSLPASPSPIVAPVTDPNTKASPPVQNP